MAEEAPSDSRVVAEKAFGSEADPKGAFRAEAFWPGETGREVVYTSVQEERTVEDIGWGEQEQAEAPTTWRIERGPAEGDGRVRWEERRYAEGELVRIDRLQRLESGELQLLETVTKGRAVISRYDPPMIILPATLEPGETLSQDVRVTVHPESDPEQVQNRGDATNTIEYVADQRVRTPVGEFMAARLESKFEGDFGVSTVTSNTTSWLVEDLGLVAERYEQQVQALLPISQKSHWFVIVKRPQE